MIRVRTIGQSAIEIGERVLTPDSNVLFAVCLYLLFNAARPVPRSELLELFWPHVNERTRRHRLRQSLYRLKQLGVPLELDDNRVRVLESKLNVREERGIAMLRSRLQLDSESNVEFLPSYSARFSAAFRDWLETERQRASQEVLHSLLQIVADARARSDFAEIERAARLSRALDPLSEPATLALAEALATRGCGGEAVRILDRYISDVGPLDNGARRNAMTLRRRVDDGVRAIRTGNLSIRSEFVGRQTQMRLITSRLSTRVGSPGAAFLLHGDAGIGKTRLATEVGVRASLHGYRTLQLQAHAGDANRPLAALIDLVPLLLGLPGSLGTSPDALHCLERIVHRRADTSSNAETQPDTEHGFGRIQDAFVDLVDAVHAETPLFIRVEDAHWLDHNSVKLVKRVAALAVERGWIVVATVRTGLPISGNPDAMLDEASFLSMRVPPLNGIECRALLRSVIPKGPDQDDQFEDWCLATSDGNPLFLIELARHFVETGERAPVPHSLADLLDRRLRALSPPALLLLQCICVFGKGCSIQRLEQALEFPGHTLTTVLDELSRAQLLIHAGDTLACRHDLLAESALSRLSDLAIAHLHRRVGTVLENDYAVSHSFGALWDAARHWSIAGDRQRALDLACQCGTQLVEIGLAAEAADVFRDALGYTQQQRQQTRVRSLLAEAQARAGHWADMIRTLEMKQRLGYAARETDGIGADEVRILEGLWRLGATADEIAARVDAACLSKRFSPKERAEFIVLGLKAADNHAEVNVVESMVTRLSELRRMAAIPGELVLQADVIYHASYGDLDVAVHRTRELLEVARLSGSPVFLGRTLRWAVETYRRSGLLADAWLCADEAISISEERASPAERLVSYLATVFLAQYTDAWDRAEPALQKAKECGATAAPHDPWVQPAIFTTSARAALQRHDMDELRALSVWRFDAIVTARRTRGKAKLLAAQCAVQDALHPGSIRQGARDELGRLYALLCRHGDQDHLAAVLMRQLLNSGARDNARNTMCQYLGVRRERYHIPNELELLRLELAV